MNRREILLRAPVVVAAVAIPAAAAPAVDPKQLVEGLLKTVTPHGGADSGYSVVRTDTLHALCRANDLPTITHWAELT